MWNVEYNTRGMGEYRHENKLLQVWSVSKDIKENSFRSTLCI